ncbi:MAG: hypothetical protein ACTSUC_17845 [Promethearchaeota archaeon]
MIEEAKERILNFVAYIVSILFLLIILSWLSPEIFESLVDMFRQLLDPNLILLLLLLFLLGVLWGDKK